MCVLVACLVAACQAGIIGGGYEGLGAYGHGHAVDYYVRYFLFFLYKKFQIFISGISQIWI